MNPIGLKIYGMKCNGCANSLVKKFLTEFPDARFSADAVTASGLLVPSSEENIDDSLLFIRQQGYRVHLKDEQERKEKGQDLVRLAIAFFCFMNIMIFALAEYFAAPGEISDSFLQLFRSFQVGLASVGLFYGAYPILKNGYYSIINKRLSVDLSISFALLCAYAFSLASLFNAQIEPFFDSIAATIFFILVGRFFQNRFLREKNNSLEKLSSDCIFTARRKTAKGEEVVDASRLEKGDALRLLPGEMLTVASQLVSDTALVSLDLISGESEPVAFNKGDRVPAGAFALTMPLEFIAGEAGEQSQLRRIQSESFALSLQKSQLATYTDRLASYFYLVVVLLAVICFIASLDAGLTEAVSRFVAILLVACPCAFAVALPMASLRAAFQAHKKGILFKSAAAIQSLAASKAVIFDKTGTLSELSLRVQTQQPANLPKAILDLLFSAVSQSNHPASRALFEDLEEHSEINPDVTVEEVFGRGLLINLHDNKYRFGSASFCGLSPSDEFDLFFTNTDQSLVVSFKLSESLASGVKEAISSLKDLNLSISILSGDHDRKVASFANDVGITRYNAESSPERKRDVISKVEGTIMVGNGFNDALAISRANVGVSVAQSNSTAFQVADLHLLEPDLRALPLAIKFARESIGHIKQAFGFSVSYNLVAIALAFFGFLTPVVAAILMPINGIIVSIIAARKLNADEETTA